MDPEDYWSSTLREIGAYLEARMLAQRDARDMIVMGAWYTEAFARHDRLPDLGKVLSRPAPRKTQRLQSLEELQGEWQAFFARTKPA
jgi:hypothetical protein